MGVGTNDAGLAKVDAEVQDGVYLLGRAAQ